MSNIIELNSETLFYIPDDTCKKTFIGVGDSAGMIEFINNTNRGTVNVHSDTESGEISRDKFQHLCIAWLALNYPNVLKVVPAKESEQE